MNFNIQATLDKTRRYIHLKTSDKIIVCVHNETKTSAPIIHTMNGDKKTVSRWGIYNVKKKINKNTKKSNQKINRNSDKFCFHPLIFSGPSMKI